VLIEKALPGNLHWSMRWIATADLPQSCIPLMYRAIARCFVKKADRPQSLRT